MKNTTNRRRAIAACAALAGIAVGVLLTGEDAEAGRLITGKQIRDSSLTGKDLRNGTVTSEDVTDGSLSALDYRQATAVGRLAGARDSAAGLVRGPAGDRGPKGPSGDIGARGAAGLSGLSRHTTNTVVASQDFGLVTTPCPSGKKVVAGGVLIGGEARAVPMNVSAPLDDGAGWQSMVRNGGGSAITLNGWALCATAS